MKGNLVRLTILCLLIALAGSVIIKFGPQINIVIIRQLVEKAGLFAPLVFIGLYTVAILCFLPVAPLTIAAGLLWGPVWGTILSLIGAMSGGSAAFLVARYLASDWVHQNAGKMGQKILKGIKQSGWKFVATVRLVPVFPFAITNYVFGVTPVSFKGFWFASVTFMGPGVFAYAYLGSLGEEVLQGDVKKLITKILFIVGIFTLLACVPWLLKLFQQKELVDEL